MAWTIIKELLLKTFFDNIYNKSKIVYDARGKGVIDVRSTLYVNGQEMWELNKVASKLRVFDKDGLDEDATMYKVQHYTNQRVRTYVHDINQYGIPEYWSNAYNTWKRRKGDCDDVAILMKVLSWLAGIPDYRMKCCWVSVYNNKGGYDGEHLNNVYRCRRNGKEEFLEGTYKGSWPGKYGRIRFTFNREHSWAQHDIVLTAEQLQNRDSFYEAESTK